MMHKKEYYKPSEKCMLLDELEEEVANRLRAAITRYEAWSVTVDKHTGLEDNHYVDIPYETKADLSDGVLTLTVQGRVDSITATDFMQVYEQACVTGEHNSIVLEIENLQYISSAGLRVLVIMKKNCDDLVINGANQEVRGIFDVTGFSNVLDIK